MLFGGRYESVQTNLLRHRGSQNRVEQTHPVLQHSKMHSCWWQTQRSRRCRKKDTYHHQKLVLWGLLQDGGYSMGLATSHPGHSPSPLLFSPYSLSLDFGHSFDSFLFRSIFLLLQVYKLPADRFCATYCGGDDKLGLPADTEARDNWLQFLSPSPVLPFGCNLCPSPIMFHPVTPLHEHRFERDMVPV